MVVAGETTKLGRFANRITDKALTPIALKMARSRTLGNVALKTSYSAGLAADLLGFRSWTMGSSLARAAELQGFASYSALLEANNLNIMPLGDRIIESIMPESWRKGVFQGSWSTNEYVKWGYFAVALHVQVLTGVVFFPNIAREFASSLGTGLLDLGVSTGMAVAFTYGMLGGHHASHVLEAARTMNLEKSVQDTVGANLIEKMEDESVRFKVKTARFWRELGSLVFLGPLGKHSAVLKDGFNYRVNGTPTDNVNAAGPKFDQLVSRIAGPIGLGLLSLSIYLRVTGNEIGEILSTVTPKALALAAISFLGRHQDNNALFAKPDTTIPPVDDRAPEQMDADARAAFQKFVAGPRNSAVYGGDDSRFKNIFVAAPEGDHNAIQAGKHTEYRTPTGQEGNTSPDLAWQEKKLVLLPGQTDDPAKVGFFGTLEILPQLQNQVVGDILTTAGIAGGGRENEGGVSFNGYGGGDLAAIRLLYTSSAKAGAKLGYKFGNNMFLGLDNAADADDAFNADTGMYKWKSGWVSGDQLVERYMAMYHAFGGHILSFEDPFAARRDQWQFWQKLNSKLGDRVLLIGDDILCTNPTTAYEAISQGVLNAGLVKLNQVGSFVQAWMYMELFHSKGLWTEISHRSTQPDTLPDPLEVTAALGASYRPDARVVLAKLGGVFLSNRAGLYYAMQQAIEDWRTGSSVTSGIGPDVKIASITAYPSPLGAGKYGLMASMRLDNGIQIASPIPGGLSRGEGETRLMGPKDGVPILKELVDKLGLVGKPLGAIKNVFDIERTLMAMDIAEAVRKGALPSFSDAEWDKYEAEAAFKTQVGGDVTLSLGQLMIKAAALRDGLPPWLVYRLHGQALNEQIGMSFANYPSARRAFYEPIFRNTVPSGIID